MLNSQVISNTHNAKAWGLLVGKRQHESYFSHPDWLIQKTLNLELSKTKTAPSSYAEIVRWLPCHSATRKLKRHTGCT